MRILVFLLASISFFSLNAQSHVPVSSMNYYPWPSFPTYNPLGDSNHINQKWYISKYIGFATGFGFLNGYNATYVSAPVGFLLNRLLNNNLIAFAGISAAPAYFNFNQSITDPNFNKYYPGGRMPNANGFGMNARAELGLMYINDAKTFSISGSIGIDQSSYPAYPVYPSNGVNTRKQ